MGACNTCNKALIGKRSHRAEEDETRCKSHARQHFLDAHRPWQAS